MYAHCGLLLPLFIQKKYDICLVKGCGTDSQGKQYCEKHMSVVQRRKLTHEMSSLIRSSCCDAKCMIGKVHDNGEQYCKKCKQPCCWKAPR